MNAKKWFLVLFFLMTFSIFIGYKNFGPTGAQIAKATSNGLNPPRALISCIHPKNASERAICADIEAQILGVTIRIEMHYKETIDDHLTPFIKKSYATILDGKYLVTHNHFKYSLRRQVCTFGDQNGYTGISLRTNSGTLVLQNAPLNTFRIIYEDREILVLAFIDKYGNGLFEAAGLPSGQFADIGSISLEVGDELAQIDWDGERAQVDWVRVDKLSPTASVPQLQVNNYPKLGSSGGGVFWNGIHIGNTWGITMDLDPDTGETLRQYSTVALNTSMMLEAIP